MMKNIFYCLAFLSLVSCKDDESEITNTPHLEFVSISPSAITEFKEEVTLVIKYTDGDGDLGENDPDIKNLFVTDQRNGVEYSYRIPQLSPSGSNITIEGNLEVDLNTLSVVGSSTSEQVVFDIYIIDRSDNQSNTISSSPITVSK
tara:strand:- start:174 stop:611 length:438 start_codon:yes stop_codon:yes gene_type:complete